MNREEEADKQILASIDSALMAAREAESEALRKLAEIQQNLSELRLKREARFFLNEKRAVARRKAGIVTNNIDYLP